jgi:DNA-binding response OmpR family regulator
MNLQTSKSRSPLDGLKVTDSSKRQVPNRTPRILVADDNEGIRHLLSVILADAGFDVSAASDGQEAWEALLYEYYDLLITDNEMPRLAGVELIKRMCEAGMSTAIIIASSSLPTEKLSEYPMSHIAAVLPKPFPIVELLTATRHALKASCGDTTADLGISTDSAQTYN